MKHIVRVALEMSVSASELEFRSQIDNLVHDRIPTCQDDFSSLVCSLPGVYPFEVLLSVRRLVKKGMVGEATLRRITVDAEREARLKRPPKKDGPPYSPHPLDFEWIFAEPTITDLSRLCVSLSKAQDVIALLGVPSLYAYFSSKKLNRRFLLFNRSSVDIGRSKHNFKSIPCDLRYYSIAMRSIASVVLMDSPWYADYVHPFLWNASRICRKHGHLLMVAPKVGTRPGMDAEWESTLKQSRRYGFMYLGLCSDHVLYETPYFERNALRASGIQNIPRSWRSADLAVFAKVRDSTCKGPSFRRARDCWTESRMGICVRLKGDLRSFKDPRLIPIIPGNILPSVSRRNTLRGLADVWTCGNRIFACKGTGVLSLILDSMHMNESMMYIQSAIHRRLDPREKSMVSFARQQVSRIVRLEQREQMDG